MVVTKQSFSTTRADEAQSDALAFSAACSVYAAKQENPKADDRADPHLLFVNQPSRQHHKDSSEVENSKSVHETTL